MAVTRPLAGSTRTTVPSSWFCTHTEPWPIAMPFGRPPTRVSRVTAFVSGSIRSRRSPKTSTAQIAPNPAARPMTAPPGRIVAVGWFVTLSMRTIPSIPSDTHTESWVTARLDGAPPTSTSDASSGALAARRPLERRRTRDGRERRHQERGHGAERCFHCLPPFAWLSRCMGAPCARALKCPQKNAKLRLNERASLPPARPARGATRRRRPRPRPAQAARRARAAAPERQPRRSDRAADRRALGRLAAGDGPLGAAGLRRRAAQGARVRRLVLRTAAPGYVLECRPRALDLDRFTSLCTEARATADAGRKAELLNGALALWRGEAARGSRQRAVRARGGVAARAAAPGGDRGADRRRPRARGSHRS